MPGRLKFLRTGCLTRRFCSTSCRMFGGRPQVWKWRERVRSAHASSAFLPQPQPRHRQGGGNGSGQQQPSCRLSSFLPAPSPTAGRRCPRWRLTAQEIRRQPCASRNSSTSIHWVEHRSSPFSGKATISSGNLPGRADSDCPQRVMEGIPTRPKLARSPWPSVMNDNRRN